MGWSFECIKPWHIRDSFGRWSRFKGSVAANGLIKGIKGNVVGKDVPTAHGMKDFPAGFSSLSLHELLPRSGKPI